MPGRFKLDADKLRASSDTARFLAFERDIEGEAARELDERRRRLEEHRRTRERRARKKRMKVQAAQQA